MTLVESFNNGLYKSTSFASEGWGRLVTMSPFYTCVKPCSKGTHNETVKNLALFFSIVNGVMMESRLRISIPWEYFQSNLKFYHIYTLRGRKDIDFPPTTSFGRFGGGVSLKTFSN